jgi:hypothetical protein
MVQIDKVPGSQINQLTAMLAGRVLYDSTLNVLRLNDSTSYNNILMHKDIDNNLSNINNVVTTGTLGINTSSPDKQVEINSSTGDTLRLTYDDNNGTAINYVDLLVTSGGDLTLSSSGGNINITSHNGTTGLKLNGTLITSSANQLNYVNVTPGTATASKALVLDSSLNLIGINDLESNTYTGTLLTEDQPNIISLGTLTGLTSNGIVNIAEHNGTDKGLQLGGTLVTSSADELNYLDGITPGIATASKALIFDSNRNIVNINYMETSQLISIKQANADNVIDYPISIMTLPDSHADIGLGSGIEYNSVNSDDEIYNCGYVNCIASDITAGSESTYFDFKLANVGYIDSVATISNNGVISASSFVELSDVKLKENIEQVSESYSLEKILQIDIKSYNYIKDSLKTKQTGIIAQELENIFPEAVYKKDNEDNNSIKSIKYTQMIPHLINCIKELYNELQEVKQNKL